MYIKWAREKTAMIPLLRRVFAPFVPVTEERFLGSVYPKRAPRGIKEISLGTGVRTVCFDDRGRPHVLGLLLY